MFDLTNILPDKSNHHYLCKCECASPEAAEEFRKLHFKPVRMQYYFADLYNNENILILDTPTREKTKQLALLLNEAIERYQNEVKT